MSPEQTLGLRSQYGPPCDIWAIGIILHELLAGRRPFCEADTTALFESIRIADPPPLPTGVPELVGSVARKCLVKSPHDRYQSASAVAQHLEDWLAGRPVVVPAPPPPMPGPATPPWIVAVCVCALLALVFLPPALNPFGQAREVPPVASDPAPMTLVQLLNLDGRVRLTDDKGKPLLPVRTIPGYDLAGAFQRDYHRFWSHNAAGMLEFTGEKLPLPIRLEGDIGISLGSPAPMTSPAFAGVYVGRRNWPGASREVQSCISFTIAENSSEMPQNPRFLWCKSTAWLWEREEMGVPRTLGDKRLPWRVPGQESDLGLRSCKLVPRFTTTV